MRAFSPDAPACSRVGARAYELFHACSDARGPRVPHTPGEPTAPGTRVQSALGGRSVHVLFFGRTSPPPQIRLTPAEAFYEIPALLRSVPKHVQPPSIGIVSLFSSPPRILCPRVQLSESVCVPLSQCRRLCVRRCTCVCISAPRFVILCLHVSLRGYVCLGVHLCAREG